MIESVPSMAPTSPPETGAFLFHLRSELLRDHRRDRARVDDQGAFLDTFEDPVLPDQYLLDLRRVGQHRNDDVGSLRDLPRAAGDRGAVPGEFLGLRLRAVKDDQLVARFDQVLGHRLAHDPEPYETYSVRHCTLL
jgi:hypothetical protein